MTTKRRRDSAAESPARPMKKTTSTLSTFPLLSLPPEILDEILSYVLYMPTRVQDGFLPPLLITRLPFEVPALKVCREMRQRGLALITYGFTWISVTAYTGEAHDLLHRIKSLGFTMRRSQLLPDKMPSTIEMVLGEAARKPKRTQNFNDESTYLLVPYNYLIYQSIICKISSCATAISNMTVRLPSYVDSFRKRLFELEVLPRLHFIKEVFNLEVQVPGRPELDKQYSRSGTDGYPVNIRDFLQKARLMVDIADNLEAEGHSDESALWLCHCGLIFDVFPNSLIPGPDLWIGGEVNPDSLDAQGQPDPRSGCNVIGNEVRTIVHRIEYRACLAFCDLYRKHGSVFLISHYSMFTDFGVRWRQEGTYPSFGLSDKERAELHHAMALATHIKVRAFSPYNAGSDRLLDPEYDEGRGGFPEEEPHPKEQLVRSIREIGYACALDPGNEVYSAFRTELLEYPPHLFGGDEAYRAVVEVSPVSHHNLERLHPDLPEAVGITRWTGDLSMLQGWGGPAALRYFPLTQKKLGTSTASEHEITKLDGA